ncbi:MAG TPA: hypothetical protein VNV85_06490 [Puia sp.]|jgi:uncharacterized membrane protein HdeD (DUF308 family)|nr:hypothetical protein [Puia sp.]
MNWKIIIGILLIIGGGQEFFSVMHNTQPLAGELGCITLIAVGVFLIVKGRSERRNKF